MRICTVSFHSSPFSLIGGDGVGGMNVYLKELCSALTHFPDIEIDIFTRTKNPEANGRKKLSPRIRVVHLDAGPSYPVDRKKLYDYVPEFTEKLHDFILFEKKGYDLIYSHYWLSGLVGEKIKASLGLPLVHTYHTVAFLKERAVGLKEHKERLRLEERLAHTSDLIISSSEEEKRTFIHNYAITPEKVLVFFPGVNKEVFKPYRSEKIRGELGVREDQKILLYVGRIDPVKGLQTVIRALRILEKADYPLYEKLKLVIVGGGRDPEDLDRNPEVSAIKKQVSKKGLNDKVLFLGSRKQGILKEYYTAADALVVPSLYESFGLVVVESLACGTPVLVSKVGKMKSLVKEGKNGFVFAPNDPDSLALCIKRFFFNRTDLCPPLEIRKDVIHKFSWETTAARAFSAFKRITESKKKLTTISPPDEILRPA